MALNLNTYKRIKDLNEKSTLADGDFLVSDNAEENSSKKFTFANLCTQLLTKLKIGTLGTGYFIGGQNVAQDLANLDGQLHLTDNAAGNKVADVGYTNTGILQKTVGTEVSNVMVTDGTPTQNSVNPVQSGAVYGIAEDVNNMGDAVDALEAAVGDITDLETTATDLVEAVNEVKGTAGNKVADVGYTNTGILQKTVGTEVSNVMVTDGTPTQNSVNPVQSGAVYGIAEDVNNMGDAVDALEAAVGDITDLETTATDLVEAVNEVKGTADNGVKYVSQTLTEAQKTQARSNIGAADSGSITNILGDLATVQSSTTASRAYAIGEYLIMSQKLYRVTAAISSGGTITVGTNVVQTTVASELANNALYFTGITVSAATNGTILSKSDARITADHVVASCTFAVPGNVTTDAAWTTAAGSLTMTGTCTAATTANIVLVKKDN